MYVHELKLLTPLPSESELPQIDTNKELPNAPGNLPINAPSDESIVAVSNAFKSFNAWLAALALVPV